MKPLARRLLSRVYAPLVVAVIAGVIGMAAATLWWVTFHHHHREIPMRPDWREEPDGVQPADPYPPSLIPLPDIGTGYPIMPETWPRPDWQGYRITSTTQTNSPAWESGTVGWQRSGATGLA